MHLKRKNTKHAEFREIKMKITTSLFASTLFMLSFQAAVYADFNSHGFPCVKDLCVSDGADKLIKLSWQPLEGKYTKG